MKNSRLMKIAAGILLAVSLIAAAACGKKAADDTEASETAGVTEEAAETKEETVPTLPETTAEETASAEESSEETSEAAPETESSEETAEDSSEEVTETETETETETAAPAQTLPPAKNGLIQEGGNTYYYRNGVRQTGFQIIGGKRYYFQSNGVMLKNTTYGRYTIDASGVCRDRFGTISASNLASYVDFLLDQNSRTLQKAFNYIWKNYTYRYAPRIGTLEGMTEANRIAMICRFLNNGVGPCTDFAYTLQYFCERLGYQARVVTGEGMNHNEHDWVLVQVSPGTWRHMDALYKTQYFYLLTDEQLARFDGNDYRFRWDRGRWTSTTATGTGGETPETTEAAEAPTTAQETTAAATTEAQTEPETTTAAPPTETAAETPEATTQTEPETTAAAPPPETAAETPEATTQTEPETTAAAPPPETTTETASAATESSAAPTDAPEDPGPDAAGSGEDLVAEP